MRMLPAREGQAEVIESVIERYTGNADAVIGHVSEIGQPQPTWRMLLPEDNVLFGSVEPPPAADAPLQGTADTRRRSRDGGAGSRRKWPPVVLQCTIN